MKEQDIKTGKHIRADLDIIVFRRTGIRYYDGIVRVNPHAHLPLPRANGCGERGARKMYEPPGLRDAALAAADTC